MRRWSIVCACASLALLPLAAVPAEEPFAINAIVSLTGPGAFLGKNEAQALALVEDRVNHAGGIAGRPIKFVIQDDQSNPQVAVELTRGLLAQNPPIILGSTLVASCNAMAPLMKNGPVLYCFSAGMHPDRDGYGFTYGISTYDLIGVTLRYWRNHGWNRIALLTSTDASGQDGERGLDQELALPENAGVTVVAREHYGVTDISVGAQLTRIKAAAPQAVLLWGTGSPFGTMLRGVADAGLDVPFSASASNLTYAQMKQFGSILPRQLDIGGFPAVVLGSIPKGPLHDAVADFVDAFKSVGVQADGAQSVGWDPAQITVAAFKKLGLKASAAQLREYIAKLHNFYGANGEYDFRDGSQRGLAARNGIMVRWDAAKATWVAVSKFGGAL